jgi:DNA invertase Pin-like site-specific DNA recombinase
LVARKTGWSFSTVWRVAQWAGIELTAGRKTMGRRRVTARQRAAVLRALSANPNAFQREIAQQTGVSRVTVSRIEGGIRRPRRTALEVR